MVRKYPKSPPPEVGARSPHSAALVALTVGGEPYVATLDQRPNVYSLMAYWGEKLGRRFTGRKIGKDLVIWRVS